MTLKEQFTEEMKQSMKSGDKLRLSTVRLLLSEIKNAEIRKKGDLTDEETLGIVAKEVRRRKEAIEGFEKGGRQDLVDKETLELGILQGYLPDQLSDRGANCATADVGRLDEFGGVRQHAARGVRPVHAGEGYGRRVRHFLGQPNDLIPPHGR